MAVSDIRLSVDFFQHPKTIKLERRLGIEGVKALLSLWMWAAQNRPDGVLSGLDPEDIEIAAGWIRSDPAGSDQDLVSTLVALRWLDEADGVYCLHEWEVHNPWAAGQQSRSNQARLGVLARRFPEAYARYAAQHPERNGISKEEYEALLATVNSEGYSEEPEADTVLAPVSPQQANSIAPLPDPDPNPKAIDPKLSTGLSTVLSTGLSTSEGPRDKKPPAKGKEQGKDTERDELHQAMELIQAWAGYRPGNETWLRQAVANYPRLSIPAEIEEARRWVLKRNMAVKNPKAFMLEWFKRVAKERG